MQRAWHIVVFGYEQRLPANLLDVFSGEEQRHLNHLHNIDTLQHNTLKGLALLGRSLRRRVIKKRRGFMVEGRMGDFYWQGLVQ